MYEEGPFAAYCGQDQNRKRKFFTTWQQAYNHESGCGHCRKLKKKHPDNAEGDRRGWSSLQLNAGAQRDG